MRKLNLAHMGRSHAGAMTGGSFNVLANNQQQMKDTGRKMSSDFSTSQLLTHLWLINVFS